MNNFSHSLSRRSFLAGASSLGALCAAAKFAQPLPAFAGPLLHDPRIAAQPIADKGFASVRKIGNGLYATIADRTKGLQARCNGGFLVGRDAALMVEGFQTTAGAAFQLETLRTVTQAPVRAAINTHWHFDHTMGNAVYGAFQLPTSGVLRVAPIRAVADLARRREPGLQERYRHVVNCRHDETAGVATLTEG